MEGDGVERVVPAPGGGFGHSGGAGDVARPALQRRDRLVRRGRVARPAFGCAVEHRGHRCAQPVQAALANRDGGDDGHAEVLCERLRRERQAVPFGEIDHVERDDHREIERDQLQREAQVQIEVGGIHDDDERIRAALPGLPAEQDIAGNLFVGRRRIEAVGAGKVDQLHGTAIVQRQPAGMALDRHAGIIADLLAGAGECVEQGGFAGVGIADEHNQREGRHVSPPSP